MSNLVINIRFGRWFLQMAKTPPHPGASRWSLARTEGVRPTREPWFEVYQAPWL